MSSLLRTRIREILATLLPPLGALALQLALWNLVRPHIWFLSLAAVFLSSWLGSLECGLIATALSAGLVLRFFVSPALLSSPRIIVPTASFIGIGVLFAVSQDRMRQARRRAGEALAASEQANQQLTQALREREVFAALVENSGDFIGVADPEGKPVYVNPAGRRMVGLSPEHPVETTRITDYYAPARRAFATDVILRSMLEHGFWRGETEFRNWQTNVSIPVSDEHFMIRQRGTGALLGMGTVTRDITERKRLEREIRRSEAKAKFFDEAGTILASTLEYEKSMVDIARRAVRDAADFCTVDVVGADGKLGRLTFAGRDPARAWACDLLTRMPLDHDRPHLVFEALHSKRTEILRDVSPNRLAEIAQTDDVLFAVRALKLGTVIAVPLITRREVMGVLAFGFEGGVAVGAAEVQLAEGLAQRVALALESARLYRAAQQAVALRDEVLRVVAHDLRNPLGVVQMQASVLRKQVPESGWRKLEMIEHAATRMNRLIQDLLEVQVGRHPIEPARVTPGPLIAECVDTQAEVAASRGVELRPDIAEELPDVWADRDRLLQVFENLIGNALKFTPEGGRVIAGAKQQAGEVLFWVADSGNGIAPADIPHLFERFWQASSTSRGGTGLGLPIAKGIIEAHGGRMWAESTLGQGSTFFFTLPTALRRARQELRPSQHG